MYMHYESSTAYLLDKRDISYEGVLRLKSALSVLDRKNEKVPKAFFEFGDMLGMPKIKKATLDRILGKSLKMTIVRTEHDILPPFAFSMSKTPLPHQVAIIENTMSYFEDENPFTYGKRVSINLNAGMGKTYIAASIVNRTKTKFLFLVNSADVARQAYESFKSDLKPGKDKFLLVTESGYFKYPHANTQGIFMTHAMFRAVVLAFGIDHVRRTLMDDLKIGMKIMDEFDMEVSNMYYMDTMFNFKYNLYLTATQYKSILDDDKVFQLIYSDIKSFGSDVVMEQRKDITLIKFHSKPSPGEYMKITTRSDDLFKVTYNSMIGYKDVHLDYIMEQYRPLFDKLIADGGQVAFFVGRIDACSVVRDKLIDRFGIDPNDIGVINTSITGDANRSRMKEKPWLVTIMQSFGRGVDSPILRCIVYLEMTFSKSQLHQSVSRVGRIGKKYGHIIYTIDFSFPRITESFGKRKRDGFFREQFKNIKFDEVPETFYENYIHGYRRDSDTGKEMSEKDRKRRERSLKLSKLM